MRNDYADAVLRVASLVGPGSVLSYGDVAELLDAGGPRQVGAAMSRSGVAGGRGADGGPGSGVVPWWRVIRANGTLPDPLAAEAQEHWAAEATPLRGGRVDMARARWRPTERDFAEIDALAEGLSHSAAPKRGTPMV
ncbi:MGMT family protein [Arthrobacter halodurans]|uniref:MGMT family protein n=1 Tax=Arthrobacter halodurans TaxID=516699 RepID=A0ABV4USB4_9MICC